MKSGIYSITVNEKVYIGGTKDLQERKLKHLSSLRFKSHLNPLLQEAFNLYGEDSFVFTTLEHCPVEELLTREQHWIDKLLPEYNIVKVVTRSPMFNRKHTDEAKRLNGEAREKPCFQYNLQGNFIQEWPSRKKASEQLSIKITNISACINHSRSSAGGFVWTHEYVERLSLHKQINKVFTT